jgi:putative transposase
MAHKYIVDLTAAEQEELCRLIKQGKPSARQVARAPMLLHAAEGATDEAIAGTLRVGRSTVHRTRQRRVAEGLANALTARQRPGTRQQLDGKQAAF